MSDRQDAIQVRDAGGQQRGLVTHAVLVGLTPLIPVPLLDDLVKNYFRRRMVRSLAASAGRTLDEKELDALASERERGCLTGCLFTVLVYPVKAIFRKVFYFLEIKRAVDLASRTYHFGYVISYALRPREGGTSPLDLYGAKAVNEAAQEACRDAPIKPVEAAIGGTFRKSRNVLRGAAALLAGSLRRVSGRAQAERVAEAIEAVEPEEERELEPVVTRIQRSMASVPEEHFRDLRARFDSRLNQNRVR
ncbi:MAG TPA: hypothetical protein VGP08_26150 [Pyrinomonadaceae bacterium]|jgi:hypothetical protein|nr:hypothetical protein [Pyrinomonadaceae bacterium]